MSCRCRWYPLPSPVLLPVVLLLLLTSPPLVLLLPAHHVHACSSSADRSPDWPLMFHTMALPDAYACVCCRRWDSWARMMQPLLQSVPMAATPGNHDVSKAR